MRLYAYDERGMNGKHGTSSDISYSLRMNTHVLVHLNNNHIQLTGYIIESDRGDSNIMEKLINCTTSRNRVGRA